MSAYWLYEVATGKFLGGGSFVSPPTPGPGAAVQEYHVDMQPNPVTERYDPIDPSHKRPATPEEIDAEFQASIDAESDRMFSPKALRAFFLWVLAHRLGKTPAQLTAQDVQTARAQIRAIYRTLNGG